MLLKIIKMDGPLILLPQMLNIKIMQLITS